MRAVFVALAIALHTTAAVAAPCKDCVFWAPAGKEPAPLLVVLHGDREHASAAAARWKAAAKKKGWALLALECPAKLGCKDSFWKWDGDPSWVHEQIAAVATDRAIDSTRVVFAGWSGGASYLGYRAQAWTDATAIVIHGGGMAPADDACIKGGPPVYFLVGDKNPLHYLAKNLRAYFTSCKREVTWDLISGAGHPGEKAALTTKKAEAILDWATAPR